jgi:AcrR family transcriptional regulator
LTIISTHLRADAQRNLELILEAARAVFAEEGLDASVADVAERAGVGTATIFRRFPTKDDLVEAVLAQELAAVAARARALAESDDPGAGIEQFMREAVEAFILDRCLCEASGGDLFDRPRLQELVAETTASVQLLLQRAQDAGAIRADVVAEDIGFLINAVSQAGLRLERTSPGTWRRYLDIQLDGLQADGARPLRQKPPTLEELHAAKHPAAASRKRKTA